MKKIFLFVIILASKLVTYGQSDVYLKINHLLGIDPFVLNSKANNNVGYFFDLGRTEYYISSISITHDGGKVTKVDNTWILVNATTATYELLGNYSITAVENITFSIGVETPTNNQDPSLWDASHPLAPRWPSMHWGWAFGYRFIAMEGNGGTTTPNQEIGIHCIGNVLYFSQTHNTKGTSDANGLVIELNADYQEAFRDMNVATGVVSHGQELEAKKVAENFRDYVFSVPQSVSVNEQMVSNGGFKIYPNPLHEGESIKIEFQEDLVDPTLELIDLSGRTIDVLQVSSLNDINFSKLDKGIYFAKLWTKTGDLVGSQKIVVVK